MRERDKACCSGLGPVTAEYEHSGAVDEGTAVAMPQPSADTWGLKHVT